MNLTNKIFGLSLAAFVGFTSFTFADDTPVSGRKSLEQRIAELEAKLKDQGVGVKGSGIKISGYVDTSYIVNLSDRTNSGPVAGSSFRNTGRVFDNQFDAFNLNTVKLTIEKGKDSSKYPAGFRVDTIYGDDANVLDGTKSAGGVGAAGPFGTGAVGVFNDSKLFVEQAYINLGVPIGNGIDVKIGKMVSLIGYEVIESPANWQFSRSDGFRLSPWTQTGATFGYQWNDTFTTTMGVINGLDRLVAATGSGNFNTPLSFVGRLDVNGPRIDWWGDFNAYASGLYGNDDPTNPTSTSEAMLIWNIGGTWDKPFDIKEMTWGIDYLYRYDQLSAANLNINGAAVVGGTSVEASVLSVYGKWDWNKHLTTSGRFSYSTYANPGSVSGANGTVSLGPLAVTAGGFQPSTTDNYSYTLTQAFNVWKDTLVRLEWRHDWTTTGATGFGTASGTAASRDDIRDSQDTIAVNVVYSF